MTVLLKRRRIFRPARSTSAAAANVINTCTTPTIIAHTFGSKLLPAALKIDTEKKITALIPENCWKNIKLTQMKKPLRLAVTANKSRIEPEPFPAASNSFLRAWIAVFALQCLPQNHLIALAASVSRCYRHTQKNWHTNFCEYFANVFELLTFFNSQIGLSGKKNKPIKFKTGIARHNQLSSIHEETAPTQNTIKIPMVRKSWKHVPSIPRIDVSAYSLTYTGHTTHDPPIARPEWKQDWFEFTQCDYIIQKHAVNR